MKKEWVKPGLMKLGLESTREEGIETTDEKFVGFFCEYCEGKWVWGNKNDHMNKCHKPSKPGDMLPKPGEGGPIPTFS